MAEPDMLLDLVDARGRRTGRRIARRHVFSQKANFQVAHLFLFNSHRELLLQKIAPGLRHEGQWGSSAAGYVAAGDNYRHTIELRAKDELGISGLSSIAIGKTTMIDSGSKKFIALFIATYDGALAINPLHAAALEFVSISEIEGMIRAGRRSFTATFLHVFNYFLSRRGATP